MDAQDARDLLVNAMGSLFAEAEMEATLAEANGLSKNEYNKIIEEGLELPEFIKKYRTLNKQRQLHEEEIIKHQLRETSELLTKPKLIHVFILYPQFQEDYKLLKKHNYIMTTEHGLKWIKTIQSLAEYFGNLPITTKRKSWKAIEDLFEVKDLKHHFSQNGSATKKQSKDYEALQSLLSRKNMSPEK